MRWIAAASMLMIAHGGASAEVQALYVMPMSNGLDQFVASRLAASGAVKVVADPRKADAVLTDRIGEGFEERLAELREEAAKPKKDDRERPRSVSLARGKGTVFLVDANSRQVLWSAYHRPRNSSPDELNKTAGRIVEQFTKELHPKPKQ